MDFLFGRRCWLVGRCGEVVSISVAGRLLRVRDKSVPSNAWLKAWASRVTAAGTVLALKFVYYLGGKKAVMSSMPDDTSILAYEKAKGNYCRLDG
jgi:hypothetical protein